MVDDAKMKQEAVVVAAKLRIKCLEEYEGVLRKMSGRPWRTLRAYTALKWSSLAAGRRLEELRKGLSDEEFALKVVSDAAVAEKVRDDVQVLEVGGRKTEYAHESSPPKVVPLYTYQIAEIRSLLRRLDKRTFKKWLDVVEREAVRRGKAAVQKRK